MRHTLLAIGLLMSSHPTAFAAQASAPAGVACDIWIRHGRIIDGTGGPPRPADVLIRGDRIIRVGPVDEGGPTAALVIDASGMVVTPGFIDTHAHGNPAATPEFENFVAMGVTTICLGQDGESPEDLPGWMKKVEQARPALNVATFVGHGAIRDQAGVGLAPEPTADQLAAMQGIVRRAMADGCLGLSTGLEYQPGSMAQSRELAALAEPVSALGGLVMSHLRTEDDDGVAAAVEELLAQGRGSGCPVHISHIKVTYGHGAARAEQVLGQMQRARQAGLAVTADLYPYCASYTGIAIVFPDWAKPPHDYRQVVRDRRAELADYLRRRVLLRNGPEATLLGTWPWTGKTLARVASELGKPFEDVLIDDIGLHGADAAYFVMDAPLQDRLAVDPHIMICSDGSPTSSHPRGYGAFARVIRDWVVDRGLMPLETAVHKMTGLSAAATGLDRLGRGRLVEGAAADVLVFDPAKVRDHATYESPRQTATGFAWVVVNGRVVRKADRPTGERPGRLLRRPPLSWREAADRLLGPFGGNDVPGAAVSIVCDGRIFYEDCRGMADLRGGTPVEPRTSFRLASVTKQFTAMCIIILKERGRLGYDDPVSKYLPELPPACRAITIRHLVGHTSGLVNYEDVVPAGRKTQLKDSDVLHLLAGEDRTYFAPGSQYRYSNSGYTLLALIVERVSGEPFAAFLAHNIFEPLGMGETVAFESGVSTVSRRAFGFRHTAEGFVDADQSLTSAVLGDGGIYTSLTDYRRWDQALYTDRLVTREGLEEAFTSGHLSGGQETAYGFGWRIRQHDGTRVIAHDGSTTGFSTAVRRVPTQRLSVVVLVNREGNHGPRIADALLDCLLTQPRP